MQLRVGYELIYDFPQQTPMMLMLNIHHTRASDIVVPDFLTTNPSVPLTFYRDTFGNWCTRMVAPPGQIRLSASAIVNDSGVPEPIEQSDWQHAVQDLPEECLQFLLGSRYCETDRLSELAWSLFQMSPGGAQRVQAICDYVHQHIAFSYADARSTRTAWEAFNERAGVCRDFAHLAIAFCRCMNIPARYCTGYLGDVGVPPPYGPMDFAAWLEAYVDGRWHTFDPRNNVARIGRILIARGRDATDVAISNVFGPSTLVGFKVWVDEISERHPS
jgi:transglutaminase-like putative cysteine protease